MTSSRQFDKIGTGGINLKRMLVALLVLFSVVVAPAAYASDFGIDVFVGNSWHANQTIKVGQHKVSDPQWKTRPFEDYLYYSARIRWGGHEIEWLHDKVYMGYDTADIQGFNISDGYNFALYNFVQKWGPWEGRLGAGPIIVHPEGVIDGYEIGYHGGPSWRLGGIGFQLAGAYRGHLWSGFSWIAEAKLTTGVVHLTYPAPVHEVYVPVSGQHLLVGVGYDF